MKLLEDAQIPTSRDRESTVLLFILSLHSCYAMVHKKHKQTPDTSAFLFGLCHDVIFFFSSRSRLMPNLFNLSQIRFCS